MASGLSLLGALPAGFSSNVSGSSWAHYDAKKLAVLPGHFNRSIFDPPWVAEVENPSLLSTNEVFNTSDFIAFSPSFFSLIGPSAQVSREISFADITNHEASCYIPSTKQLFFVAWGYSHNWQLVLDVETNTLKNITTSPPTWNVHGCVHYDDFLYVATDGGDDGEGGQYAIIVKIDPKNWTAETVINNFYEMPFLGFNDLDIDRNGNFWVTDSISAWGRDVTAFTPQTTPAVYFNNATTLVPKWVFQTPGNANGIASHPPLRSTSPAQGSHPVVPMSKILTKIDS
ncbi:hypothetical protein ONS95_014573 [Cadophora gregata]|uniref:uncharacterized protein n=1 Tax=Cadophora gregata TaxID=51156 RepID=UPI0026DCBBE6|nr:uncharacterized protein ONS95_014573 [Cadophora gregata]KAK0112848.1 hypothetical protein ONS95_014573 [Cadophora gregata]KAK0124977.1 hypothetical protein ONS96_008847 [Cadophora gregata f. sp. sojae]